MESWRSSVLRGGREGENETGRDQTGKVQIREGKDKVIIVFPKVALANLQLLKQVSNPANVDLITFTRGAIGTRMRACWCYLRLGFLIHVTTSIVQCSIKQITRSAH
jgi:hypothetical protein